MLGSVNIFAQKAAPTPETQEIPVSQEIVERINLYWTYYNREDWEKLYDLDDTLPMEKADYVAIKKNGKNDPYVSVAKILEIAIDDKMSFAPTQRKPQRWQINGCARFVRKDGQESWGGGSLMLDKDEEGKWRIFNILITAFIIDGKRVTNSCTGDVSKFPINIKVSELK